MKVLLGLLLSILSGSLFASALQLGVVRVPVADHSVGARAEALSRGVDQVLVRLTGTRSLDGLDGLGPVRSQPARWAQQFSYTQSDEIEGERSLFLSTNFDVEGILASLQSTGAPMWGQTRPDVLTWMVIQRPGAGQMLAHGMSNPVVEVLRSAAVERGLPVLLPLMDEQDQSSISVADVRGHFDHVLMQASERYKAPLRLAAVLYTGTEPRVRWRLFRGITQLDSGEFSAEDEAAAMRRLVDEVTDPLAQIYVIKAGSTEALTLEVSGVKMLSQWYELQSYMKTLTGVEGVSLSQLTGTDARFSITFSGSTEQLQRLLALKKELAPCVREEGAVAVEPLMMSLSYCWQPG